MLKSGRIILAALLTALFIGLIPVGAMPVAESLELETYRGVSVGGQLRASGAEGLRFELTTEPVKGEVVLNGDGSFVYTPREGKRGRDYFGYRVTDAEGNRSQEATVIIRILKQETGLDYCDMAGNAEQYAAIRLAEGGVFVGKCLAGEYYFEPEAAVTRSEFLSMCLSISGTEPMKGVLRTGFSDDEDIPAWLKSEVSAAVSCGLVKGYSTPEGAVFNADGVISRAEAAVMLDRLLGLSDVDLVEVSVPVFAAQAAANLSARDIIDAAGDLSSPLTRADAAHMLAAAMNTGK